MAPKVVHRIPKPPPTTGETSRRLQAQARRCAAGDHVYAWTGQTVEVPGGSPHLIMACAYGALHDERRPSPRLIGPLLTPENIAKRLWTKAELERRRHNATPERLRPSVRTDSASICLSADSSRPNSRPE